MSAMERARDAYGDAMPDWVNALAMEADRTSQGQVAKKLSYTVGAVNSVLGKKYGASTDAIETRVRGILMAETVPCPMLGQIGAHSCKEWQARERKGNALNGLHKRMAAACRTCERAEVNK